MKKSLFMSFKAAFNGLFAGFRERNMIIHAAAAIAALMAAAFFRLSAVEYAVIILTIAAVMSAELFNTAIEKLVDMVSPEFSRPAGMVKDIAAAAVLVCAIGAVAIAAVIFGGHIFSR